MTNLKDQLKVRGTVKAAELKGDANCPNLCSVSVYDTKPVHFMTMANDRIEWIKKKRKIYNKDLGKQVDIDFLHINITDDYNYGMGQVDISE